MTRFVVTAICNPPEGPAVAGGLETSLRAALDGVGAQVLSLEAMPGGLEVLAADPSAARAPRARACELRRAIALATAGLPVDLAVQEEAARTRPRLLVMDMDSTLITIEVIDELARLHGVGAEVAAITERAMRGELDFEASLRARVSQLAGLPAAALDEVAAQLVLSDGAARLISALQGEGAAVAIASGGFTFAAHALRDRLGLTAAHANRLEIVEGVVTGRLLGEVVDAERKAAIVRELAAAAGVTVAQAVAIGDGANDRLMLAAAGFGVAFRAKPVLARVADATIDHGGLDRVLAFVGER